MDRHLPRAGRSINQVARRRARPTDAPQGTLPVRSIAIGPGRSSRGTDMVRSSTVDSRPTTVGPLSMIRSMRPSRSASTWSARVGESRFARFALGAAIGWPGPFDEAACDLARRERARATVSMTGRHDVGDDRRPVEDERERPRPESCGQRLRPSRAIR